MPHRKLVILLALATLFASLSVASSVTKASAQCETRRPSGGKVIICSGDDGGSVGVDIEEKRRKSREGRGRGPGSLSYDEYLEQLGWESALLIICTFDPVECARLQGTGGMPSYEMIENAAISLATEIIIPDGQIGLGPDPSVNEWNMIAVGQPLWLWVEGPAEVVATHEEQGITLTLYAIRGSTTFTMDDGTTVTCASTTQRPDDAPPLAASPTCGHTYKTAATRTISSLTTWEVIWEALGLTGSFELERPAQRTLDVGELTSVVVR